MDHQGRGKQRRRLTTAQKALVQGADAQLLVERQVRLAMQLDWRLDIDDVRAIAHEALILAAPDFDASRKVPFAGFAYRRVKGAVVRHMHGEWLHRRRRAALTSKRHHALPDDRHTAEEQEAALKKWANDQVLSWSLAQALTPDKALTPEEHLESAQLRKAMVSACQALPADHAQLVEQLYGEGVSLRKACAGWGKSYSALQRMHVDALARLRFELSKAGFNEYPAATSIRPSAM